MAVSPIVMPMDEQRSVIRILTLENILGSKLHQRMCAVSVWYTKCYHNINCEPMSTEIQGGINKYKQQSS